MSGGWGVRRIDWSAVGTGCDDDPWDGADGRVRLLVIGTSTMGWRTCLDELAAAADGWDDIAMVICAAGSGPRPPSRAAPLRKSQLRHAVTMASWQVRRRRQRAMEQLVAKAEAVLFANPHPPVAVLDELERRTLPIGVYLDATVANHASQSGWHTGRLYQRHLATQRRLAARCDVVACMSEWAAHSVRTDLRARGRVLTIPPSVAEPDAGPLTGGHRTGDLTITLAGNPWLRKGADRLVGWLGARPDARVSVEIFSTPPPGTSIGSDPRVRHLGTAARDEVLASLAAADLVVCATRLDQSPFVIAESAMRGTPAIAPHVGGVADLIDHGRTGYVYGPHHDNELWELLDSVTAQPELVRSMRDDTREHAHKHFSPANYRTLVEELLAARVP